MLDPEIKKLWLEKVSVTSHKKITTPESSREFSVNTCLYEAPPEVLEDYDINMQAAITGQEFLWNLHKNFKDDKVFLLDLMSKKYTHKIYSYINYFSLAREDLDIIEGCLKRKEEVNYFPYKMMEDKSAVLRIMKYVNLFQNRGGMYTKESKKELELFIKTYKKDIDVMKVYMAFHRGDEISAIKQKQKKLYVELLKDKEFVISLFKNRNFVHYHDLYSDLSEDLREDASIGHQMLKRASDNVKHLPKKLQENRLFMLDAIKEYNINISVCPISIQEDEEILTTYINENKNNTHRLTNLCHTAKMAEIALQHYTNIDILNAKVFCEHHIIIQYLLADKENVKRFLPKHNYCPEEVLKVCVSQDYTCLDARPEKLNETFAKIALEKSNDIRYVVGKMRSDRELVYKLLLEKPSNAAFLKNSHELSVIYKNDYDIVKKMIDYSPDLISVSPKYRADKELATYAIEKGLDDIYLLDPSLYFDKTIALTLASRSLKSYIKLPYDLKNDHDIALAALSSTRAFEEILLHSDLYENKEFYVKALSKNPNVYNCILDNDRLKQDLDILYSYVKDAADNAIHVSKETMSMYNVISEQEFRDKIVLEYKTREMEALENVLHNKLDDKLGNKTRFKM